MLDRDTLKEALDLLREDYELKLKAGQSETWRCDQRTNDIWCLGHFIDDRYSRLEQERRRALGLMFNRIVRSVEDPFEAAVVVINVGDSDFNIEDYSQHYWTAKNNNKWNRPPA
jgi:hypothetical protein